MDNPEQSSQPVSTMPPGEEVLYHLLLTATLLANAEGGSVWLWAVQHERELRCEAVYSCGIYSPNKVFSLPVGRGFAGWVARNNQAAISPKFSANAHPYYNTRLYPDLNVSSVLGVPLRARGDVIGVLEVVNKVDGTFTNQDMANLESVAGLAGIAIDQIHVAEVLRQHITDLQNQVENLDVFAHTVAHDLKNPLDLVLGYAGLYLEEYGSLINDTERSYLQRIVSGGDKLNTIVDELLLLAEVRKADVQLVPLDMPSIVAQALSRLGPRIDEAKAKVTIPDSWPVAWGYGPWVEEVWVNYLNNALQYGYKPPEMELGATPDEHGMIRFWLRNRGAELLPGQMSQLFKAFSRLNQVRTQGYGLGLSIVRRIVEQLGGEVGVTNEVGYGPVFSFTLHRFENRVMQ